MDGAAAPRKQLATQRPRTSSGLPPLRRGNWRGGQAGTLPQHQRDGEGEIAVVTPVYSCSVLPLAGITVYCTSERPCLCVALQGKPSLFIICSTVKSVVVIFEYYRRSGTQR